MAWRIDEQLIRGVLDNRRRGEVSGTLWFVGLDSPVILTLKGNPWRDLAGRLIRITNPAPTAGKLEGFNLHQHGAVGDITASRKVRVPEVPVEEIMRTKQPFPWHWGNCLYMEWFSRENGRVVIESVEHHVEVMELATWEMSEEEEHAQCEENQRRMTGFMDLLMAAASTDGMTDEEDQPKSFIEAEADAEDRRQQLLLDRIGVRMDREYAEGREPDFAEIMEEEREKLRKERGEPEPEPLTPEQEAEQEAWIEEMNRVAEEALAEMDDMTPPPSHPLKQACQDLGVHLYHEIKDNGWIADDDPEEHPLREIEFGVQRAAAKLAGALNDRTDEEWPPDPLFAGDTLVRLKKARGRLQDALAGLDSAEELRLATAEWRIRVRHDIKAILAHVKQLIQEVRQSLDNSGDGA